MVCIASVRSSDSDSTIVERIENCRSNADIFNKYVCVISGVERYFAIATINYGNYSSCATVVFAANVTFGQLANGHQLSVPATRV